MSSLSRSNVSPAGSALDAAAGDPSSGDLSTAASTATAGVHESDAAAAALDGAELPGVTPEAGAAAADEIPAQQRAYWRSLSELERSPQTRVYLQRALGGDLASTQPLAEQWAEELANPVSRRNFLQLMGASMALAGMAGCQRWEEEKIVPLSQRPDGYIPGVPKHYASVMELGGFAEPVLVAAYDGRPIKIEGNPDHPGNGRGSSAFAQASILELYDPDRSQGVARVEGGRPLPSSWEDFDAFLKERLRALAAGQGAGLRVLSEGTSSPTVRRLQKSLLAAMPQARWHEYEPLTRDNEREGTRRVFGAPHRPIFDLEKADVVLVLDSDLLLDHPAALRHARDFARRRRPDEHDMSRIYAVESHFSTTGGVADHRLPLRSELVLPFLMALDAALSAGAGVPGGQSKPAAAFLAEDKVARFLAALGVDLLAHRGRCVVAVGHRQPPEAHALVARINAVLGNVGTAVQYVADPDAERPHHVRDLGELVADMKGGKVDTLLILGGNPIYNAPAELDFAAALGAVKHSVHLSLYQDETSVKCSWHLPRAHYLEAWGDARSYDGTWTVAQPIVQPIFGGRSAIELLALVAGRPGSGESLVRDTFATQFGPLSEIAWRKALHDGFVAQSGLERVQPQPAEVGKIELRPTQLQGRKLPGGTVELNFVGSTQTHDGRFANSSWLQETPDFMTKLTWDNAALVSPATAAQLGVAHESLLEVAIGERKMTLPVYVMPGHAASSITVALGYGRTRAGHVGGHADAGVASVGHDSYRLRTSAAPYVAAGASARVVAGSYKLASTQDHHGIDELGQKAIQRRAPVLVREASLAEYKKHPTFVQHMVHHPPLKSLWDEHQYKDNRWAMSIDLGNCTGCNACMLACQAENNVPVVGKANVMRTREMHWIRIDRYFVGDADDPQLAHQPVTCQQCELAPCEQVCPVGATTHSHEGLNDMAYNRCIGTRYCANNCPYKVRRFNFLDYHKANDEARNRVRKLLFNPDVTVRSRGVMEKCTFCVQRIEGVKIRAKNERRTIRDGEITPACAQACPSEAIVFGDLSDAKSRVSVMHRKQRAYDLLEELHTKPRNRYLARIRNPNPELG
jgi:molybdopterin-containing oxidoreductase family iron-sulfur binding subunit